MSLSPDAELLLLIFASHGGMLTKFAAEDEFVRVRRLPDDEFAAYVAEAKRRAQTFAAIRRDVDER
jgi:hypothetical protein